MKFRMFFAVVLLFSSALNAHYLDKLKALESHADGRVGVYAVNTSNDCIIEYARRIGL